MDGLLSGVVTTSMVEACLVELISSNLTECILVLSCACPEVAAVALVNWVACTSRGPLLSQLCFCNCFRDRIAIRVVGTGAGRAWEHDVVAARVEELGRHHHLLLLGRGIRVWGLPLINKVQQMSLISCILMPDSTRSSNPVVSH